VGESLDEIVWAVNPRNDTLPDLIEFIGQFAVEFLHTAGLRCRVDLPDNPLPQQVSPEVRHNLFLVLKEALNNIARHAEASEVRLRIAINEEALNITLEDNGKGFEGTPSGTGADGLHNMQQRMSAIGGICRIESKPGFGTSITLILPWAAGGEKSNVRRMAE
jgi:signal transduction histidine kinase